MSELTKTALVTGGSRGIGKEIAKRLAADGFQVYLTYVSKPELAEQVVAEIAASGGKAKAFLLDSGDREAVARFFAGEIKDKVLLSVLVNNAGITRDGLIMRMKDDDWDKVLDINLSGAFAFLREAAKIMTRQREGRIINISSVVGQSGNAGQANYSAAKAGLIGLTKASALELASRNVTVNAVAPGFIETDMTAVLPDKVKESLLERIPLKRLGQAADIAAAVSFLASDGAGYVTGQVLAVNGGMYM
ncbi:3-oxoacyl-[acyl-carrier-protein] reductase [Desulfocurvibacter africanus]|uniref:3-oxoacyl-[acyl-carrier-protein] reductase n=1 Tax=Desulfocurvibacter africanus subsp. africanus str. Walvis Bay TaxID=690850 RepID=F3YXX1_DESAF|nr:3-oxoacyl-[acyl-carrier-protein] reductase [Desulfocurvibacter africanus]EGJ50673.1 3-oxoacyl-(acyl-carrier-protein) reductase [Desulfocurvibacter africanus subsp. africanus str. Walvis Bay]